ncbi:hypothetical protein J31TS4_32700 [Paenibacillus sp. J31TS4]|uniref:hypothetical protein n=1 Tax=Paenibacillus sp. J31TS4 TaxID=2807195 RepID=UPI001B133016|nr:hypothetical protein [Paenibacillus sp. J31TS4]GIP39990.1 hypothetical protein J31TS4_32700 [Paenibacillus sp. J31TS4]
MSTLDDERHQGREEMFMDIDRMINEGLGGGNVTIDNGMIGPTTTDTMLDPDSILEEVREAREDE